MGIGGSRVTIPDGHRCERTANFTNEVGADGRMRFLHNVMGLWLLSESIRHWERDGHAYRPRRTARAGRCLAHLRRRCSTPKTNRLPDPRRHARPHRNVVHRKGPACAHHQGGDGARASWKALPPPSPRQCRGGVGAVRQGSPRKRCTSSAGALRTGCSARGALHDRVGVPVLAGPVEATALGNVKLIQARTHGLLAGDLEALRALVAAMFPPQRYTPRSSRVAAAQPVVTG